MIIMPTGELLKLPRNVWKMEIMIKKESAEMKTAATTAALAPDSSEMANATVSEEKAGVSASEAHSTEL
jgi:hypothetical protein